MRNPLRDLGRPAVAFAHKPAYFIVAVPRGNRIQGPRAGPLARNPAGENEGKPCNNIHKSPVGQALRLDRQ